MLNRMRLRSPARQESGAHGLLITSKQLTFSYIINNWKLGMKWEAGSLNRKQCQQPLYLENTHKYKAFTNSTKHCSFYLRQRTPVIAKTISYILLGCKRGLMDKRSSKGSSAKSSNNNNDNNNDNNNNNMLVCKDIPRRQPINHQSSSGGNCQGSAGQAEAKPDWTPKKKGLPLPSVLPGGRYGAACFCRSQLLSLAAQPKRRTGSFRQQPNSRHVLDTQPSSTNHP